jgi:hypothetical protein
MADEKKPEPEQKYLEDFKGTPSEQRKAKSDFISKHGFDAYEALVKRSTLRGTQR